MKRTVLGWILIVLGLVLAALLLLRRYPGLPAGLWEAPAATEPQEENPAAPTPASVAEKTPAPTLPPTPEPTPTPRPLLAPELCDGSIDPAFFAPSAEPGTLCRDVTYTTRDSVDGREGEFLTRMQVYLPYGYDENGRYDVLFLLHVRQSNERFWLEQDHAYDAPWEGTATVSAVNVLDKLIERGLCRPMLVIALDGYLDEAARWAHRSEQVYPQFAEEFGRDILPFVAAQYATWAEGTVREQLRAAREHFGVLGASFGAYQTELSVLAPNLDLVSWYAMTGGGSVSYDYLYPQWSAYGTAGYPIDLVYFVEGEYDDIQPVESSYQALGNWTEVFTRDENLRFTRVIAAGHEQREWVNALFNTAQLFFR